jgi:hypothetical protein
MRLPRLRSSILALTVLLPMFSWSDDIRIVQSSGKVNVQVPTYQGKAAPLILNTNDKGFFFSTITPNAPAEKTPPDSARLISLGLHDLQLVRYISGEVAAAIYPVVSFTDSQATAIHVLQKNLSAVSDKKWYGFIDENQRLLDVAMTASGPTPLLQQLSALPDPTMGEKIQALHLTLIQNTDDLTLSRSITEIVGVSHKYFYFKNSPSSQVGPQSSGAVVYDLKSGLPAGVISCLAQAKATGPSADLIRAISLKDLSHFQIIELTPELVLHYQSDCLPYDGKNGGGD